MKTDGRPVIQFQKRPRKDMLTGMLLGVVSAALSIDLTANARAARFSIQHMDDSVGFFVLVAVHQRYAGQDPGIVRLSSGCRIERRAIQYDSDSASEIQ